MHSSCDIVARALQPQQHTRTFRRGALGNGVSIYPPKESVMKIRGHVAGVTRFVTAALRKPPTRALNLDRRTSLPGVSRALVVGYRRACNATAAATQNFSVGCSSPGRFYFPTKIISENMGPSSLGLTLFVTASQNPHHAPSLGRRTSLTSGLHVLHAGFGATAVQPPQRTQNLPEGPELL